MKAVSEVLDFREWFVIAEPDGLGDALLWGMFSSEKEAEKALAKLQGDGAMLDARIYPVRPTARPLARRLEVPLTGDCECGHPKWMHLMKGVSYDKCGLSTCKCKKFNETDYPPPEHPTCITCKQPTD